MSYLFRKRLVEGQELERQYEGGLTKQEFLFVHFFSWFVGVVFCLLGVDEYLVVDSIGIDTFLLQGFIAIVFAMYVQVLLGSLCVRYIFLFSHVKMKAESILFFHVLGKRVFNDCSHFLESLIFYLGVSFIESRRGRFVLKRVYFLILVIVSFLLFGVLFRRGFGASDFASFILGGCFGYLLVSSLFFILFRVGERDLRSEPRSLRKYVSKNLELIKGITDKDIGVVGRGLFVILGLLFLRSWFALSDFLLTISFISHLVSFLNNCFSRIRYAFTLFQFYMLKVMSVFFELLLGFFVVWCVRLAIESFFFGEFGEGSFYIGLGLLVNFFSCCLRVAKYRLEMSKEVKEKSVSKGRSIGLLADGGRSV